MFISQVNSKYTYECQNEFQIHVTMDTDLLMSTLLDVDRYICVCVCVVCVVCACVRVIWTFAAHG